MHERLARPQPSDDHIPPAFLVKWFQSAPPEVRTMVRAVVRRLPGRHVRWGNMRRVTPYSNRYGYDRGLPVDRYYIERFLAERAADVRGDVLEVKEVCYGTRFGSASRVHVVDIDPSNAKADIVADLNQPGSLPPEAFDCVILTQVLQFLEPELALRNLMGSLRPGGVILLTVPALGRVDPHGAGSDSLRWTPRGIELLLGRVGAAGEVSGHGNVLACVAGLWGLAVEDLSQAELAVEDDRFPLVVAARILKPQA